MKKQTVEPDDGILVSHEKERGAELPKGRVGAGLGLCNFF